MQNKVGYVLEKEDLLHSRFTTAREFEENWNSLVHIVFEMRDMLLGKKVETLTDAEVQKLIETPVKTKYDEKGTESIIKEIVSKSNNAK